MPSSLNPSAPSLPAPLLSLTSGEAPRPEAHAVLPGHLGNCPVGGLARLGVQISSQATATLSGAKQRRTWCSSAKRLKPQEMPLCRVLPAAEVAGLPSLGVSLGREAEIGSPAAPCARHPIARPQRKEANLPPPRRGQISTWNSELCPPQLHGTDQSQT